MFRAFNPFRSRSGRAPTAASAPAPAAPAGDPLPEGKPADFGTCWNRPQANLDWYTWMYNGRIEQHRALQQWFTSVDRAERIESVLEFGCGLAVGYADFFRDRVYTGADLAPHLIDWCRANRPNPAHTYVACDFINHAFPTRYDLVMSQGTIDNTYDMDAFLRAAVRASRRWVFITAYRGFFADLPEHRLEWRAADGCYYNDLSPTRAAAALREAGASDVAVLPSFTGRAEIPFETMIVARVRPTDPA
jgi:SAM-dependent methyltransferase